jgi:hexosaminidase
MRKLVILLGGLLLFIAGCKNGNKPVKGFDAIIPLPAYVETNRGSFELQPECVIHTNDTSLQFEAAWLKSFLKGGDGNGQPQIYLEISNLDDSLGDEGYILDISSDKIRISARTDAGVFYGIQSLRQLLPVEVEKEGLRHSVMLPQGRIIDKPRFEWRGLLLDCCRHFMDKDFVLRYIDLLAMQKMNRFHWHLTEDQGWRIEIKKFPLLTEVGAWRTEADGSRYGGYYTQEEIREVVAYALDRHIEVVPEIEMPGHSLAALAAYPELSCTGGPFSVETTWGVFKDIYCAGNDKVFDFMEGVLSEVIELFPSRYIHIGGDEAPRYRWENCNRCQDRMQAEGLKEEAQLQTYFIGRVSEFLATKNRQIIGWDEILEGGLMAGATVQSWRGMEGAIEAVSHGHDAIVSPTSHAYFDYPVRSIDVEKVYSFDPVPEGIPVDQEERILGGECNMWSERAPQELVDQKLYPRILAMAEVFWTARPRKDFRHFMLRLEAFYPRLDALGVDYGPEMETVRFRNHLAGGHRVITELIPGQKGTELYYHLTDADGNTLLKGKSAERVRIAVARDALLNVEARMSNGTVIEQFERGFSIHKLLGKKPVYRFSYSPNYAAAEAMALCDGVLGTDQFRDGNWQGYEGVDMDVTFDLGRMDSIRLIGASFLQSAPSWIFMPTKVEFSLINADGGVVATYEAEPRTLQSDNRDRREVFFFEPAPTVARFVRVKATNVGVCPPWHPGAGGKSWVFADEIVVK